MNPTSSSPNSNSLTFPITTDNQVAEWNASPERSTRVILGGSCIPNSTSFLAEVSEAAAAAKAATGDHKGGRDHKAKKAAAAAGLVSAGL